MQAESYVARYRRQRKTSSLWSSPMDRASAMDLLPEAHALALRLSEAGADDGVIASGLQIEPEGVPSLLELAKTKLEELMNKSDGISWHGGSRHRD